MEQTTGIEPAYLAWEASALPLSYVCVFRYVQEYSTFLPFCQGVAASFFAAISREFPAPRFLCRRSLHFLLRQEIGGDLYPIFL